MSKTTQIAFCQEINGIKFYPKQEMIYSIYKPGDVAISMDLSETGAKCYALFPNTLAVQTFIMSLPKNERYFYEITLFSSKNSIRNYPIKLFFDIDAKDENKKRILLQDSFTDCLIHSIFTNVSDILRNYYAIDYSIKDLVIIDSGDHINLQDRHFYEEKDGFYVKQRSKEETEQMKEEAVKGKYTSFHLVFNSIHFVNIKSLEDFMTTHLPYISRDISQCIDEGVYKTSGCLRLAEFTKRGRVRHLTIATEQHDFQDSMLTSLPSSSILIPTLKKDLKRQPSPTQTPTPESVSKIESLFLSNIHHFVDDACSEYHVWVNTGIFMKRAGFDVSTFIVF